MIVENSRLSLYFLVEELLTDIGSKKSKTLNAIFDLVASEVDLRILDGEFARLRIGTGYDQWVKQGDTEGFPPLAHGLEESDFKGFPHFVLSQKNEADFNEDFNNEILKVIDDLIFND